VPGCILIHTDDDADGPVSALTIVWSQRDTKGTIE